VKYAWIDAQTNRYALTELCGALEVSISGFRAWKRGGAPQRKRLTANQTLAMIRTIHAEFKGAYGSPRIVCELRQRGFTASKERVERLMREHGIRARHKRRYRATTDLKHGLPVAPNLLDRNFEPAAPNQVWTADITYLWTDERWLYLAVVLDLPVQTGSDRLVAQAAHDNTAGDRCADDGMVAPASSTWGLASLRPGSQYASMAYQGKLAEFGMTCSMSRKGNCWDNAPTESWFNSFSNERYHGVRYATQAEMKAASFEYIEVYYNRKRQHSSLGYKSPIQFLNH
jgi:putative transposase